MANIKRFRSKEEIETLEQINTVQNSIIIDLQTKLEQQASKIKHLEQLLFSRAVLFPSLEGHQED